MSVVKVLNVFCEGNDENGLRCDQWVHGTTGSAKERHARTVAKRAGWLSVKPVDGLRIMDFCPIHAIVYQELMNKKTTRSVT